MYLIVENSLMKLSKNVYVLFEKLDLFLIQKYYTLMCKENVKKRKTNNPVAGIENNSNDG